MGGDKDLTRWLRDYENRRLNPDGIRSGTGSGPRLNWHSSKYDLENMRWQEVQDIWLPELDCTWGFACNYLRKQWFRYKMGKREGDRGYDTILNINRILYSMGLPLVEFHDGPDLEWIKNQLDLENRIGEREMEQTSSDVEARYESDQEQKRSLGQGDLDGDEDESEDIEGEDPEEEEDDSDVSEEEHQLYVTLRREEMYEKKQERAANVNMILRQLGVTPREEEETDYSPIEEDHN